MFTSVEDLLISLKLRALLINEVNGMRDYEGIVLVACSITRNVLPETIVAETLAALHVVD
jgi:hypothetical protein